MMPEDPPDGLERRTVTVDVTAKVPGYPGLELDVHGLKFTVEGVPQTVPSDCTCGHGIDAHDRYEMGDERGPCNGVALMKTDEPDGKPRPVGMPAGQIKCDCQRYTAAHPPREIAFRVERLVEAVGPASSVLCRTKTLAGVGGEPDA